MTRTARVFMNKAVVVPGKLDDDASAPLPREEVPGLPGEAGPPKVPFLALISLHSTATQLS